MHTLYAGNYGLNFHSHCVPPTLVASPDLERRLDVGVLFPSAPVERELPAYAVHLHAFFLEESESILEQLRIVCPDADLWITTESAEKKERLEQWLARHAQAMPGQMREVRLVANAGRNVGPLLGDLFEELQNYGTVLHIHSKRSTHDSLGEAWLKDLVQCLAGSRTRVQRIRGSFAAHPELGLVMPRPCDEIRPFLNWGENWALAETLVRNTYPERTLDPAAPLLFPAGMMFWFQPQILRTWRREFTRWTGQLAEPLPVDGTVLHALERLVAHGCEAEGFLWALCGPGEGWASSDRPHLRAPSLWEGRLEEYLQATGALAASLRSCAAELERHSPPDGAGPGIGRSSSARTRQTWWRRLSGRR